MRDLRAEQSSGARVREERGDWSGRALSANAVGVKAGRASNRAATQSGLCSERCPGCCREWGGRRRSGDSYEASAVAWGRWWSVGGRGPAEAVVVQERWGLMSHHCEDSADR